MRFKTFFLQVSIFTTLFTLSSILVFEIPPRFTRRSNKIVKARTCNNQIIKNIEFIYTSCPSSFFKIDPGPDYPKMKFVESWIDNLGARKPFSSWKIKEKFKTQRLFLIGDSFIQADEIPYEDTVYGLINGYRSLEKPLAYGIGYSSWNPIQYRKTIEMINKKNSIYDVFIFTNDFNPSESRSVYKQNKLEKSKESSIKNSLITFISRKMNKSYTYKKIKNIYREKIDNPTKKTKLFWDSYQNKINKDKISCEILDHFNYDEFQPAMKNYIAFSLPWKCWTRIQKDAYYEVIDELDKAVKLASKLNSEIRLILIPPGWSFPFENTAGRKSYHYTIPDSIAFSFFGLRSKLSKQYGSLFIDLEPLMAKKIEEYKETSCFKNDCSNSFYFSNDGHFNKRSHQLLFDLLYKKKLNNLIN